MTSGQVGHPPNTQQSKVSFADGTNFEPERPGEYKSNILMDWRIHFPYSRTHSIQNFATVRNNPR